MKGMNGLVGIFEGMTKNQKTQMGVARSQVYANGHEWKLKRRDVYPIGGLSAAS